MLKRAEAELPVAELTLDEAMLQDVVEKVRKPRQSAPSWIT
jgi:hypothetical protein